VDEHEKGIQLGLRAAARMLEEIASDFDDTSAQIEKDILAAQRSSKEGPKIAVPGMMHRAAELREKATLLRDQAEQIRELKVTRGR
jgi:hypothetical protein